MEADISEANKKIENYETDTTKANRKIENYKTKVAKANKTIGYYKRELSGNRTKVFGLLKKVRSLNKNKEIQKVEINTLKRENKRLSRSLIELTR